MRVRNWHDWSLTAKLVSTFVLVTVLSVLAMAAVGSAFLRGQLIADLQQRDLYRAAATARALDAYLTGLSDRLKEAASSPQVAAFISQPEAGQRRAEMESGLARLAADNGFEAVVITDRSGKTVAASAPRLIGTSFANNPVFVWAIGGLTSIDDPLYEPVDQQVYVYFSAPVGTAGAPLGSAIGRITLNALDAIVKADIGFTGHGEFGALWNEHGIRLSQPSDTGLRFHPLAPLPQDVADQMTAAGRFGPKTRELIQPASPWPGVMESSQSLLRNRNADPHLQVSMPNTGPLQVSIVPLEKKRWFYGIAAPETGVSAAVASVWWWALLVIFGAAVIAAAMALLVARSSSRTMAEVTMALAVEGVPTGQPDRPPPSITPEDRQARTAPEKETPPRVSEAPPQTTPAPPQEPARAETVVVEETSEEPRPSVIAPAPVRVELAGPPAPALLQVSAIDTGETEQEPPAPQQPQEASTVEPPAEPLLPAKEEPSAAPKEIPESPATEKPGWGIPLARPPMGPLS